MATFKYKYIVLVLALLYTSTFVLWGQNVDIPYWMNNAYLYYEDFMNGLSLLIGHLWMQLTGSEVVTFRLLGWLMSMSSICLVYFCTLPKDTWYKNLNCLSLGIIIFSGGTLQIYNPDSTTVLSLSALAVYVIRHHLSDRKEILVASFLTAIASACRFPNIVVVAFVVLYMGVENFSLWKSDRIKYISGILLYFVSFVALYYMLICCVCRTFDVVSLAHDSIVLTQSASASYDLSSLLMSGVFNSTAAWIQLCGCIGYIAFLRMTGLNDKSPRWMKMLLPLGLIFLFWYPARMGMIDEFGRCYYRIMSFASAFLLIYMAHRVKGKKAWMNSLFLICVSLCASAGSNNSVAKMFPVMMALLPMVFCYFKSSFDKSFLVKSYTFAASLAAILGALTPLADNLTPTNLPNMRCQFISKELAENLHKSCLEYKHYCPNNEKALFWGKTDAHRMYVVTSNTLPYCSDFWPTVENKAEVQKLINELKKDSTYTLFMYDKTICDTFEQSLSSVGYKLYKETEISRIYKHE